MDITVLSANTPRWLDAAHSRLQLTVLFSHLDEEVEFTASSADVEPHGRYLFANAVEGKYGPIADYVALIPYAIASRKNPSLRQQCLAQAGVMVQRWDILGDVVKADAWREYYRALYALAESEIWPMVDVWPQEPSAMTGSVQIQELE
ncbi:hypothetical protein [Aeromonas enteropelogenes]|uniref:hypothetical protein n=1 Tax=Aeromonas enteropelogenes TaxID=29489 RepID=UPI003BA04B81